MVPVVVLVLGACGGESAFQPPGTVGNAVVITPKDPALLVGDSVRLTAIASDASGFPQTGIKFTWSTTAPTVAHVDSAGLLRALAVGVASISATTGTRTAKVTVTVSTAAPKQAYASISAGGRTACGLTTAGVVLCWGANDKGQLGNGTVTDRNAPVPSLLGVATAVAADDTHTCAILATGTYCWGANDFHQLGLGILADSAFRTIPQRVLTNVTFTQVSAGGGHTCALSAAGDAYCWGDGQFGQLGNGTSGSTFAISPVPVSGGHKFTQIAAGQDHTCGVGEASILFCWGRNEFGQLATGSTVNQTVPARLAAQLTFASVSAGVTHTCAVTTGQDAYCWGFGSVGQLGNNKTLTTSLPSLIVTTQKFASITAGSLHTCALNAAGAAYCWGSNSSAQLGDGTGTNQAVPVAVSGTLKFTTISAGATFTCATNVDHIAYCWGGNTKGELGTGTAAGSPAPARVSGS